MNAANVEISQLHAATCLAITQFQQGRQCPCLAKRIVNLLRYLATHPELPLTATSKNLYLNLLEHWERVSAELNHAGISQASLTYH